MTFGEKLQKLRKEAGLSQEELAWQLGVSRQAVSKWERDGGYPETEKIIRMSRIFHVTLDYLLNEETLQNEEAAKNEEAKNEEAVQKEPLDEKTWRNEELRQEAALPDEKELQNREAAGKEEIRFLFFPLLVPAEFELADTPVLVAGMIAAGIGAFLCIYMSGLLRAYRLLVMNEGYWEKKNP